MRLFQKVVALTAIAAFIVTMSTPMVADAAMCPGNDHTYFKETYLRTEEEIVGSHTYISEPDDDGEVMEVTCNLVVIKTYYWVTCMCGKYVVGERYYAGPPSHSDENCTGYGY